MKSMTETREKFDLARFISVIICAIMLGSGSVAAQEPFTPDEGKAIERIVREYILNNPRIIMEAIQTLRQKRELSARDEVRRNILGRKNEIFKDPTAPVGGNPNGDVIVVEFFDYQCSFCKRVFPSIQKLLTEDRNIRYVFKEFPILGPVSIFAARAALAAWKQDQDKYVSFHTAMMASKGRLTETKVIRFAKEVGLDVSRLRREMKNKDINGIILRNLKLANALKINGTPAFVIGDKVVRGAAELETLRSLVERARKTGFSKLL